MSVGLNVEFDITTVTRTFRLLRVADYCLIFLCGLWGFQNLMMLVLLLWLGQFAEFSEYLMDVCFAAALMLGGAYLGSKNLGSIDHRYILGYVIGLPLIFLLLSSIVILSTEKSPSDVLVIWPTFAAFCIALGWGAAVRFILVRLHPTNIRLFHLLRFLRQQIIVCKPDRFKPPIIDRKLGLIVGVTAIVLLIAGNIGEFIAGLLRILGREAALHAYLSYLSYVPLLGGLALLVRARRYFQTSADELLKFDTRQPILFLRSFEDEEDERKLNRMKWWRFGRFFDYSVETRLARHFNAFGPFIAIGSPRDSVPQFGAARSKLSDDQWQDVVTTWMQAASVIVMFAGATHWLSWELTKVSQVKPERLLLLFRKGASWLPYDDSATRFATVKHSFSNTEWAPELAKIDKTETLCAIAFHPAGSLTVVRCELTTHDTYHLGALLAHFRMLTLAKSGVDGSFTPPSATEG